METVATMLIDNDVVGENKIEKIRLSYKREYNSNHERIFNNITGTEWFKLTEAEVRKRWGNHVYLLALDISSDKTQVDRLHANSVWPCYVSIANLTDAVRHTNIGSEIIGYCPLLPYSNEALEKIMIEEYNVLKSHAGDVCVLLKRYNL